MRKQDSEPRKPRLAGGFTRWQVPFRLFSELLEV